MSDDEISADDVQLVIGALGDYIRKGAYETCKDVLQGLIDHTTESALQAHAESSSDRMLSDIDVWHGLVAAIVEIDTRMMQAVLAAAVTRLYFEGLEKKGAPRT